MNKVYIYRNSPRYTEKNLRALHVLCIKKAPFTCGVAVGSPLGVCFPSFYMGTIEGLARYVYGIFISVKGQQVLQQLHQQQSVTPSLAFSYEDT